MLKDFLQLQTRSVVFVGNFNPVIVQPFWLANKKLIRDQEAQDAVVDVIHNEIAKYSLGWVNFEVTNNRFEIRTNQEPYFDPLKDLAISIFRILKDTPITAMGINHLKYYALPDEERYYAFGNKLAPLSNWLSFLNNPRMLNLDIIEEQRADGLKGQYRVTVRPSDIKLSTPYGVLINVNDHFTKNTEALGATEIIDLLIQKWTESELRAESIVESIWQTVNTN
jgi:hypothetical protein